jgi:hypothetical protein
MRNIGMIFLLLSLTGAAGGQTAGTSQTATGNGSSTSSTAVSGVKAVLVLSTSLSSKVKVGKEIKATLDMPITLPDGTKLPHGTSFSGHVIQASEHSKAFPNGTLALLFDQAKVKSNPAISVVVKIQDAGQSMGDAIPDTSGRGSKKEVVGSAPPTAPEKKADDPNSKFKPTHLDNVFLVKSTGGSGVLLAPGAELFLDADIEFLVTIDSAPPKTP